MAEVHRTRESAGALCACDHEGLNVGRSTDTDLMVLGSVRVNSQACHLSNLISKCGELITTCNIVNYGIFQENKKVSFRDSVCV